jgi:transposase
VLETLEQLDRSAFHGRHPNLGRGRAAYDPDMLLGLLIYAYCRGMRSSRAIERACVSDVAFRVVCAQDAPDHATIARFRAEHEQLFASLFTQVLLVAAKAGLGRFGTVAIDGTKIAANASIDANRDREWLAAQVAQILADARRVDAAEDVQARTDDAGGDQDGDEVPVDLKDPTRRRQRIAAAAAEVAAQVKADEEADQTRHAAGQERLRRAQSGESVIGRIPKGPHRLAEARAHLAREIERQQAKLDRRAAVIAGGKTPQGRPPVPVDEHPCVVRSRRAVEAAEAAAAEMEGRSAQAGQEPGKSKRVGNVSDPHSRLMPTRKGFVQGYNAQVAVTADQFIVALQVGQNPNDMGSFVSMMTAAQITAARLREATGDPQHVIGTILADAGYASDANLAAPGPDRLIALGKNRALAALARSTPTAGPPPNGTTPRQAMDHRLRTPEGAALYKRRGATVEPGIGNLKKIIDRFSRRGLDAATSELHLAATAFNVLKIYRAIAA